MSTEANRICQPEKVLSTEATNPDVNRKRMHQLVFYMTLPTFLQYYIKQIYILLKVFSKCTTENKRILTTALQVCETFNRCAKECMF